MGSPGGQDIDKDKTPKVEPPQFIPYASTSELLINLNKQLLDCMNARNYTSPFFDLVTPNCHIDLHGKILKGPEGFIEGYKEVADVGYGLHVTVTNSSAIVDEDTGAGTVIFHVQLTGWPDDMKRAATLLTSWRKEGRRWRTHSCHMFYGIQEFR